MKRIGSLTLAALIGVAVWCVGPGFRATQQQAFAQEIDAWPGSEGSYLLSYYDVSTNFGKSQAGYGGPGHSGGAGDALLRIVNAGNFETGTMDHTVDDLALGTGDVCAYIYVFNDHQQMQECCNCLLTANSLLTFSVINDLTSNPLEAQESLGAGVIKIVGTSTNFAAPATCYQYGGTGGSYFAEGLHAWINHTESMASNQAGFKPPYGFVTSTSVDEFKYSKIDLGELFAQEDDCFFITTQGSGSGICTCGFGD